jgi:hypothetical protein
MKVQLNASHETSTIYENWEGGTIDKIIIKKHTNNCEPIRFKNTVMTFNTMYTSYCICIARDEVVGRQFKYST